MESLKSIELVSELSVAEILGEQGSVLPERSLMRHRRRHPIGAQGNSGAFANNGSVANSSSVTQVGFGNTNTTVQSGTVINVL